MEQPSLFSQVSLTVTDVTRYLRELLESDMLLQDVWVLGEVSNLSRPSSGHIYFTLKDHQCALRCVIWRSTAQRLRFDLQNGMAVDAHGSVSLYERDGNYQLYVVALRPAGEGLLYQRLMRLKADLETEGLFDTERKRPIPLFPHRIGIVTSPSGAALQDMLNTLRRRFPLAEVLLAPCSVQGAEAPAEIVAAIRALNRADPPDVILVARGGGSLEDLWAFNDERVVRAVAESRAPVITGVGHETDFTLVDFASDLRAPTPTGAAMLAVPDAADLKEALMATEERLNAIYRGILYSQRADLDAFRAELLRNSPLWRVRGSLQGLDNLDRRLERASLAGLSLRRLKLQHAAQRLAGLNPTAVLQRGFAIVRKADNGRVVRDPAQLSPGERLQVRVAKGDFDATVELVAAASSRPCFAFSTYQRLPCWIRIE